ncbi:MAG: nucleotidyltransferase domain-containing protein, partial [Clostridia bacterium]|nr:nucleotidyltransferase domain-containing protein [Clostridia bacterium]
MRNVLSDIKNLALSVIPTGGAAWLYGSRARGTAHRHSDWDVLL